MVRVDRALLGKVGLIARRVPMEMIVRDHHREIASSAVVHRCKIRLMDLRDHHEMVKRVHREDHVGQKGEDRTARKVVDLVAPKERAAREVGVVLIPIESLIDLMRMATINSVAKSFKRSPSGCVKCAIGLVPVDRGHVGLESRVDQDVAGLIVVDRRGRSDLLGNRRMRNRRTKTQRDFVLSVT